MHHHRSQHPAESRRVVVRRQWTRRHGRRDQQSTARLAQPVAKGLAPYGVARVHEALGAGLLALFMRPTYTGAKIAGSAVTVSIPAADHRMLHGAVEQCQAGDVLVTRLTLSCDRLLRLAAGVPARGAVVMVPRASAETVCCTGPRRARRRRRRPGPDQGRRARSRYLCHAREAGAERLFYRPIEAEGVIGAASGKRS
jgi:hypothetical protein